MQRNLPPEGRSLPLQRADSWHHFPSLSKSNFFDSFFLTQTCFLLSVNVIGQRMDFYAMTHACWLIAVLYRRRRKAIAEIWPKYCCFLACIITFQYFICIGIPPAPCRGVWPPRSSCSYEPPLPWAQWAKGSKEAYWSCSSPPPSLQITHGDSRVPTSMTTS